MYLQHFGLAQYPFSLTPNTRYFLKLPTHVQAFTEILQALDSDTSYSKVTGEVGTGKTMLCRKLLSSLELHEDQFCTAYIPHPILDDEGIMHSLADELAIPHRPDASYFDLLQLLTVKLTAIANNAQKLVLLIDEAQAMPEETYEALHLLTEIQAGEKKPMHIVLFGQPELNELLGQSRLRHIEDGLGCNFMLPAMDRDDLAAYLQHRLAKAGYSGSGLFTTAAIDVLFKASKGVPRLVNVLSHKAMMVAYGKGAMAINESFIEAAIKDTQGVQVASVVSLR